MTSPPYWGLRRYSGEQGAEPLGLEPTPERHIERAVAWAREVWRVLRDDGVFWLNYGDCCGGYFGNNYAHKPFGEDRTADESTPPNKPSRGDMAGNRMLMPHRVALALQSDGWIVRQDLVWAKPSPMPESVSGWRWQRERTKRAISKHAQDHNIKGGTEAMLRDASIHRGINPDWIPDWEYGPDYELRKGSWRHTRAHEYVFMLVKGMQYWSDQEAVREAATVGYNSSSFTSEYDIVTKPGLGVGDRPDTGKRNPRSVLHIPTAPYRGAHYATFPPALIAPLILATCPRWCCPVCGQGWAPVADHSGGSLGHSWHDHSDDEGSGQSQYDARYQAGGLGKAKDVEGKRYSISVLGHRPTCEHPHTQAEAVPGIVFDPFVGSGTSVMVANQVGRRGIGTDISGPYLREQAQMRIVVPPTGKWAKQLAKLQRPTLF